MSTTVARNLLILIFGFIFINPFAQELEPRNLTNIPVKTNFIAVRYGFTSGNVLLDPAIPIENLQAKLHTFLGAYVRAIDFFGLSGKVDLILPYSMGDWEGMFEGNDTATARNGFGDPSARLSVNFYGAPATKPKDYTNYKQKLIVGASVRVKAPLGQYDPSKLINLGSNRWIFILKAGLSYKARKWIFEAYLSSWLFTINREFYNGHTLKQKPFYTATLHAIRSLPRNLWITADVGYGIGGRTEVDDVVRNYRMSAVRIGLTFAAPINKHHTLKFTAVSGIRIENGPDYDVLAISYQYRWHKSRPRVQ